MMTPRNVIASVVLLAFVGCAPAPPQSPPSEPASRLNVADRLEIINMLNAYPHAWDSAQTEDWLKLFTKDAIIDGGQQTLTGFDQIKAYSENSKGFKAKGLQRRHLFTNILVREQTASTAAVSVYLLLMSTAQAKDLATVTTGTYNGWLVKEADGWKIKKWEVHLDRAIN